MAYLAEGLHRVAFADANLYPYVFAFPAVVLAGVAFGRNAGSAALFASIGFVAFSLPPVGDFAVQDGRDAFELILYAALATATLVVVDAMHVLATRASAAQAETATAKARAASSEQEHNLLLAEFRHRVKNDLARLAATFALRAAHASPETAEALRAASSRVHLFATIYDQMGLRKGVMVADIHDFLRDLVRDLNATIEREQPVGLILNAEAHTLPFGQASAIALIVNELVTNALKHAFPDDMSGTIRVEFRREGSDYVLFVVDDGVGMPSTTTGTKGLGSRIVRALAAQLGGRLQVGDNPAGGTQHVLRFPVAADHGPSKAP
ncbi:sensor histidine kinase [Belnapia sp. T6]|uniref:histidine kinase n=1 Tax=Belnapia mucosa TaxID=2804532 RepID=A0ABS1UYM8_9PROT|nr:sensor histidine kinase [Belnapia mucosa]MBL6454561.1 sensor histidine kinase [Belnapia mucosa]